MNDGNGRKRSGWTESQPDTGKSGSALKLNDSQLIRRLGELAAHKEGRVTKRRQIHLGG
jgi:hypothetical protein